jgi:adenylosuccinate synthase
VYEDHPGWTTDISDTRSFGELPSEARSYIERVEELAGVPITIVSVGPQRSATLNKP